MKKTWKLFSEELELYIFGSNSGLVQKEIVQDYLWDSVSTDLLTKSNGVLLRFQSTLNSFSL